ncbi:MAG: hypothetical protein AAFO87_09035, partial [Cyanobacteria bacterium J06607_6]
MSSKQLTGGTIFQPLNGTGKLASNIAAAHIGEVNVVFDIFSQMQHTAQRLAGLIGGVQQS